MCGRINLSDNEGIQRLMAMLGMPIWPDAEPRFNVAPTETVNALVNPGGAGPDPAGSDLGGPLDNQRQAAPMSWGLTPAWGQAGKPARPLINARSETVLDKKSFRRLMENQRAVLPVQGFYEWRRDGQQKTPFFLHAPDEQPLLFGCLWQAGAGPGELPEICILTTAANELMRPIHDRMPLLLGQNEAMRWIGEAEPAELQELMRPASNQTLVARQVSSYVNSSRHDGPPCVAPVTDAGGH